MARTDWPSKVEAERWEIEGFIAHYRRLSGDRSFEIVRKQERPDWIVRDSANGALLGVELTSVYLDVRSVPDLHKREGALAIAHHEEQMAAYGARVVAAVRKKVRLARTGYDTSAPLILSVYANEYVTLQMRESDWQCIVDANEAAFDDIHPFVEVIVWPLVNGGVLKIRPSVK